MRKSSYAETYEEVYFALADVLSSAFSLHHCQIFEAITSKKELFCVCEYKNGTKIQPEFTTVPYNKGLVGEVAIEKFSRVEHTNSIRVCSPILFHGELLGVICSTNEEEIAFSHDLLQIFDLLAEISASLLVRIRQKLELDVLRNQLERHLEDKKMALEAAIETVSSQFSEIKFQRDKKEYLLREVHHRVNNNLQLLSSVVNLYLNHGLTNLETFQEIHHRIQNLSAIHLILLKSLELSFISVKGFIEDLISSLRNNSPRCYLQIEFISDQQVETMSMDTLVPLGMLLHELTMSSIAMRANEDTPVVLGFMLRKLDQKNCLFQVVSLEKTAKFNELTEDSLQHILIQALCEQLNGTFHSKKIDELWHFQFEFN